MSAITFTTRVFSRRATSWIFGGKTVRRLQAAENTADAAKFNAQVVRLATAASVATTYISLLGLQDQLEILQTNLKREQDMLAGMTQMQQAGTIPFLAVAQQRQTVDSLAATLPPLVQQIEHLHTALAILVGVLPENLHLQPESLDELKMPAVDCRASVRTALAPARRANGGGEAEGGQRQCSRGTG